MKCPGLAENPADADQYDFTALAGGASFRRPRECRFEAGDCVLVLCIPFLHRKMLASFDLMLFAGCDLNMGDF